MPPHVVEKCAYGSKIADRLSTKQRCEEPRVTGSRFCAKHLEEALARVQTIRR